jgi:uncharacterized protein (TIRG00374 family)
LQSRDFPEIMPPIPYNDAFFAITEFIDTPANSCTISLAMNATSKSLNLHRNHWVHLGFGVLVSSVCLWIAARELMHDPEGFTKAKTAFKQADYRTVIPIMLATATFYWLKAVRWRLLLSPVGKFRVGRDLFPFVMIGFGLNNILPVHMGEVVRVLLFAKRAHVKTSTVAASIVLERTCDSITVLSLLSLGLIFVPGLSRQIRTNTLIVAGLVACLVMVLLLYVFCIDRFIATVNFLFCRILPASMLSKLTGVLIAGASGLHALKQPLLVVFILGLSLASWVINGLVIHLALWSFGLPSGLLISCIVLGLTAVGAAVPSAPGYVGVIQMCFMTVLCLFTDDRAGIFAASIYYHAIEYAMVTLVGLIYLNTVGTSLAQVQSVLREEPTPVASDA